MFHMKQLTEFDLYLDLLSKWQPRINLVSTSTLDFAWQRHILDSGQLAVYLPPAPKLIVDVGSGAGFPRAGAGDYDRSSG